MNSNLELFPSQGQMTHGNVNITSSHPFQLNNLYNLVNPNNFLSLNQLLSAWPEDFIHPCSSSQIEFPIKNHYSCDAAYVKLFDSSLHYRRDILVKIPKCSNPQSSFYADLDTTLIFREIYTENSDYEKFLDLYLEEFNLRYLHKSYYDSQISHNTSRLFCRELIDHINVDHSNEINYSYFPKEILCRCREGVVPTSGPMKVIKGIGAGMYSAYNFMSYSQGEDKIVNFIEDWTLDLINLGVNFNLPTIIITFLKLFKMFMPISEFILKLIDLFTKLFKNFCKSIGKTMEQFLKTTIASPSTKQPITVADVDILSDIDAGRVQVTSGTLESFGFLEPILQYVADAPVVATLMSCFVVISGGLMLSHYSVSDKAKMSSGDKIAHSFLNISKVKGGSYATIEMIKDFQNKITEFVNYALGSHLDSALLQALQLVTIEDTENLKKLDLFIYIDYLLNPSNKAEITTSKVLHQKLNFCISVIDQIHHKTADGLIELNNVSLNYLLTKVIELKKLRLYVIKYSPEPSYRFTPFWINLAGGPGTGKSVLMPKITTSIMKILQKKNAFEVPDQSNWTYPVNFTDKYLSKYAGHYCVTIDDLLQDTAPLGDRSSALDIISWISCIPYYTVQADLESKGTPFTSKIVLTTTNDLSMANRKEIISTEALKRRIKVQAVFIKDPKAPKDPELMEGVRIELRDPLNNVKIRDINSQELIAFITDEYIKHYQKEHTLMATREPTDEQIQSIERLMVTPTSGWFSRCKFGLTPNLKTDMVLGKEFNIYDCDCEKHETINYEYVVHCLRLDQNDYDHVDLSLQDFVKFQEEKQAQNLQQLNHFERAKISVKQMLEKVLNSFESRFIFKAICAAVTALTLYGCVQLYKGIGYEDSNEEVEISAAQYDTGKPGRSKPRKAKHFTRVPHQVLTPEVIPTSGIGEYFQNNCRDDQAMQLVKNTAAAGSVIRLIRKKDGLVNTAIMIKSSYMLTNHHYFAEFEDGDEFLVYTNVVNQEQVVEQIYCKSKMKRIRDLDAAIYQFDASILSKHKSIIKHFLSDDDLDCSDFNAVVMTAIPSFQTIVNLVAQPITCNIPYQNTSKTDNYCVLKSYVINFQVEFGQSGSLLIGLNKRNKRKFLGIQTCRGLTSHLGYFVPVTENLLLETLQKFNDKLDYQLDIDEALRVTNGRTDMRCPANLGNNSLYYVGSVDKTRYVKQQQHTKILPSLIQNPHNLTQQPSVLSDYDVRMNESLQGKPVIFRAVQGFDDRIGTIDRNILEKAVNELSVDYDFSITHPAVKRDVLSNFETINGIPGLIKRIEMNSSPGWPYSVERKNTTLGGKYEWFAEMDNPPEGYTLAYQMKPTLLSGLERREAAAKLGKNTLTIAYVCLKDETRPIAKIESGTTRAFICLPMDYNLLVKKYFGAFIATQHLLAGKIASCVGIDPAVQWKLLYDRLNEKNIYWEDFDYKNWDQHLHPELVNKVASVINHWYGDDDNSPNGLVRRTLVLDLVHTFIIVKDRLMIKSTGQCSGCAITAELNCIVHELLMYYVWIKLHQDQGLVTDINEFRQEVAMALYGDDILLAVKNSRIDFTGNTIKPVMESLGMGITPGNKLATVFSKKKPEELEFLKRSFRAQESVIKAPLRTEVINNIYQWIHKSDNAIEATLTNCEAALQECYMHSAEYFDNTLKEINTAIKNYNQYNLIKIPPVVKSYDDYDRKFKNQEFICLGLVETLPKHLRSEV